jgi:AraC-like DNA-binding protein
MGEIVDLLTEVLGSFHLRSTFLYRGRATAPWGVRFAPRRNGDADALFHVVTEGRCLLQLEGKDAPVLPLGPGDFVLLPHAHTHSLRDAEETPVYPIEMVQPCGVAPDATATVRFGGGGPETALVCGKFLFQDGATNPFLRSLPPLIVVRGEQGKAVAWLEATLAFLACETNSGRPGAETVLSRLCDILFIQAIRAHLAEMPACTRGWLRAMRDEQVSQALLAIHRDPARRWTVAALASTALMSRSTFAARFTDLMGEPPLQYVTRWRIHLAVRLLREDRLSLSQVAERVGYESEAAFCKTFKRWTGATPGSYRL